MSSSSSANKTGRVRSRRYRLVGCLVPECVAPVGMPLSSSAATSSPGCNVNVCAELPALLILGMLLIRLGCSPMNNDPISTVQQRRFRAENQLQEPSQD